MDSENIMEFVNRLKVQGMARQGAMKDLVHVLEWVSEHADEIGKPEIEEGFGPPEPMAHDMTKREKYAAFALGGIMAGISRKNSAHDWEDDSALSWAAATAAVVSNRLVEKLACEDYN